MKGEMMQACAGESGSVAIGSGNPTSGLFPNITSAHIVSESVQDYLL